MYLTQSPNHGALLTFTSFPRLTAAPQRAKPHEAAPSSELGVKVVVWSVKRPVLYLHVVARYCHWETNNTCWQVSDCVCVVKLFRHQT
jgi:hypothetical protein